MRIKTLFIILLAVVLSACSSGEIENRNDWEVQDFTYKNQDDQAVGLSDLEGKVWISDFMFTSCTTVCPMLTHNMAELQKQFKDEGLDVEFVSFSVDPDIDKPELLKEYAQKFNADFSNWHFLTGYEQDEIRDLAANSFMSIVQDDPSSDQVIHGTSFYLIDQEGLIVKDYPGTQEVPYEEIIKDAKSLLK